MVVKVYISGISGNKEVKKRQQRVMMILDSKNVKYDVIDITEPGKETEKDFMQNNSKSNGGTVSDPNPRSPLPPQLFNDEEYCGDYDQFDLANEVDTLEQFLKMEVPPEEPAQAENVQDKTVNGETNKESDSAGDENVSADSIKNSDEASSETVTTDKESTGIEGTDSELEKSATSKEGTPSKEETEEGAGDSKEKSPEKEASERQKSTKKEGSPEIKAQSPHKEIEVNSTEAQKSSPEKNVVNENGSQSSREQSQEKTTPTDITEVERTKDNPSDALIQSEQAATAE